MSVAIVVRKYHKYNLQMLQKGKCRCYKTIFLHIVVLIGCYTKHSIMLWREFPIMLYFCNVANSDFERCSFRCCNRASDEKFRNGAFDESNVRALVATLLQLIYFGTIQLIILNLGGQPIQQYRVDLGYIFAVRRGVNTTSVVTALNLRPALVFSSTHFDS